MTFHDLNLNKPLLKALDLLELTEPTPIQREAFSVIMSGRDVLGIAQTGTGKTMAYLLPCLRLWKFSKDIHPQTLIVVPTRELVAQVVEEAQKLAMYQNIRILGVYGGANMRTQEGYIREGVDILVATPGRLNDLILNGALSTKAIKRLVIDEVDEMLSLGFLPQLKNILDLLPQKRQHLLFSATMSPDIEVVIDDFFTNPVKIEATPSGVPVAKIEQFSFAVPNFNTKYNLLKYLIEQTDVFTKVVVFVSSRRYADMIVNRLNEEMDEEIGVIHSNKAQNTRFTTTNNFNEGSLRVLIATDLFARGLDIDHISHVINFDMPEDAEFYLHRIGRTGRAELHGESISFFTEAEIPLKEAAEAYMNQRIPVLDLPEDVELSDELIEDEKEVIRVPNVQVKIATKPNWQKEDEEDLAGRKRAVRLTPTKKPNSRFGNQKKGRKK